MQHRTVTSTEHNQQHKQGVPTVNKIDRDGSPLLASTGIWATLNAREEPILLAIQVNQEIKFTCFD
jgi:hypothetical protein